MSQQGDGTLRNRKWLGFDRTLPKALLISSTIIIVIITVLMLSIYRSSKNVPQEHQEFQVNEPETYRYHEVDEKPELISIPKALFPKKPKGNGSPSIVVEVLVDTSGSVIDALILKTSAEILEEPALKAARQAKFTPAKHNGKPVRVWIAIPISFALQ